MMGEIVDPQGNPVDWRELARCPQCDESVSVRKVITSFGGHWQRCCTCGYTYDKGQGLPPLDD